MAGVRAHPASLPRAPGKRVPRSCAVLAALAWRHGRDRLSRARLARRGGPPAGLPACLARA